MVISVEHKPSIANALYYQSMHELEHGLSHYSYEQIKSHSIPKAESEEFEKTLEEVKTKAQTQHNCAVHPLRNLYVQRYLACRLMGFRQKFDGVETDQMCPFCWFTPLHCYCSTLEYHYPVLSYQTTDTLQKNVFETKSNVSPNFNLIVYMFEHEFRRTSNTGKLLLSCIPNARLLISGYEAHEQFLKTLFETEPLNTLILYPSEESITISELIEKRKQQNLEDSNQQPQNKKWNIIVMDGTWRNARTLMRNVPETIQHIRVNPPQGYIAIFNEIRRMPQEGRVSTLEAVSWLLKDLGESQELSKSLETNLKKLVNHIRLTNCQPLVEEWIDHDEEEEGEKKKKPKGKHTVKLHERKKPRV